MDVSVIIVNYNTKQLTAECIDSIFDKTKGLSFEVILIDNASTDGSTEFFREDKRIKFIESKENIGFGRANNLGIDIAQGKYLFLLNSDTIILDNVCKEFKDFIESHPQLKIGAIGGILLDQEGVVSDSFNQLYSLSRVVNEILCKFRFKKSYYEKTLNDVTKNGYSRVGYVSGADLLMPKKVISEVGKFDPDFFMYCEESDLEKRIADVGYDIIVINCRQIIHYGSGSFDSKISFCRFSMYQKSLHVYIRKHIKGLDHIVLNFIRPILLVLNLAFGSFRHFSFREKMLSIKHTLLEN